MSSSKARTPLIASSLKVRWREYVVAERIELWPTAVCVLGVKQIIDSAIAPSRYNGLPVAAKTRSSNRQLRDRGTVVRCVESGTDDVIARGNRLTVMSMSSAIRRLARCHSSTCRRSLSPRSCCTRPNGSSSACAPRNRSSLRLSGGRVRLEQNRPRRRFSFVSPLTAGEGSPIPQVSSFADTFGFSLRCALPECDDNLSENAGPTMKVFQEISTAGLS